jgi:hypothetical protein
MSKPVLTVKELAERTTGTVIRENKKGNITPHIGRLQSGLFAELDKSGSTRSKSGKEASTRIRAFLQQRKKQGKGGKTRKRKRRRKRKTRKRKRKNSRKKRKRRKRRKTRR